MRPISAWRLAARLAAYRTVVWWGQVAIWTVFFAFPVVLGLLLRAGFDALGDPGRRVYLLALVLVAAEAVRVLVLYVGAVTWRRWWVTLESVMRANLLEAQVCSGGTRAGPPVHDPGEAMTRFRDDTHDVVHFLDTWLDTIGTGVFALAAFGVMATIDWSVTVVLTLPLAALVVLNRALTPRLRARRAQDRAATGRVTGFVASLFDGVVTVKTAGAEDAAVRRFRDIVAVRRRTALRDRLLTDALDAFNRASVEVAIGLVLLLVAPAMRTGDFTLGDLALFTFYVGHAAGFPVEVGRLLARRRQTEVSFSRMAALLPPGRPEGSVERRPLRLDGGRRPVVSEPERVPLEILEARALTCRHRDGGRGVGAVDLGVERGTLTVVTGPVGAGKSTLLRALLGLVAADGEVRWNGRPLDDRAAFLVPPRAAYLPQVPRLFSEPLVDNVLLGAGRDEADVWEALRLAGVDAEVAAMGEGVGTALGTRGVRLSGGQAQRLALARALVRRPELLVLDDLSSALDAETEQALWGRLLDHRDWTLLAVSHRPAVLDRADQVLVLDHGGHVL